MKHLIQVISASGWNEIQNIDVTVLSNEAKQTVLETVQADLKKAGHGFTARAMTRKGNVIGHGFTSKEKTREW